MSASTTTQTAAHKNSKATAAPLAAEPQAEAPPVTSQEALVSIEISGMNIVLPVSFRPGHVLTDSQARILDAAYKRQFANNQNANIKARGERFTKSGKAEDAPQTATEIAALYVGYEPAVGGTPRQSAMETLRQGTAWKFWSKLMADHNANVASGGPALIAKAVTKEGKPVLARLPFSHPGRAAKNADKAAHTALVEAYEAAKAVYVDRLLEHSVYGPQIAALVAEEVAARKAEAASAGAVPAADTVFVEDVL